MAKIMVKCPFCEESFDRNSPDIEWVKVQNNRRYAHKECAEKKALQETQEEKDKKALYRYLGELFGKDFDFPKTKRLVEQYRKDYNYTYSGIAKTMRWFYELKGNSLEKARGSIGLVPYIYNEAQEYYYNIFLAQQRANIAREDYEVPVQEVKIKSPKMYTPPPRMFDLEGGH